MSSDNSFQEKSYRQHAEHFRQYTADSDNAKQAQAWFDRDTVDAWRHRRMYQSLDPILEADPGAKWLTVGDGRYGTDAQYLQEKGADATATDISEHLLKEALDAGHIARYQVENAESLSFSDGEFDYALCKEAYHHFPRPMLALYEMLRVAGKGIVLIEPSDGYITDSFLKHLFRKLLVLLRLLTGKKHSRHTYEESGNYVYKVSRREIEKVALGLNYKVVAFKGINDAYARGVEYEKVSDNGRLQAKVKRFIRFSDLVCRLGLFEYGLLTAVIFKEAPSAILAGRLEEAGFTLVRLPDNPYVAK